MWESTPAPAKAPKTRGDEKSLQVLWIWRPVILNRFIFVSHSGTTLANSARRIHTDVYSCDARVKIKAGKKNNALESGPRIFLTLTSHQNNRLKRCINTLGTESRPDRTSADPVNVLTYGPWICFAVDQHRSDSCVAVFPPHKREWERLSEPPNVFLLAGG